MMRMLDKMSVSELQVKMFIDFSSQNPECAFVKTWNNWVFYLNNVALNWLLWCKYWGYNVIHKLLSVCNSKHGMVPENQVI